MAVTHNPGTQLRTTIPKNLEENGIAEAINRTLMDGVRGILNTAKMGHEFWPYATQDIDFKKSVVVQATNHDSPY